MKHFKDAEAVYINEDGVEVYVTGVLHEDLFYFHRSKYIDFGWELFYREEHDEAREAGYTHGWYLVPNSTTFFFQTDDMKEIEGKVYIKTQSKPATHMERYYILYMGDIKVRCVLTNTPEVYEEALAKANKALENLPDPLMKWRMIPDTRTYKVELEVEATWVDEATHMMRQLCDKAEGVTLKSVNR